MIQSKLTLDRTGAAYRTVRPTAKDTPPGHSSWDEHIFFIGGTAFRVTSMWRETAATPVSVVSMALFRDCLYSAIWTSDDTFDGFRVSPMTVIANLDAYPVHKARITGADLAFAPIVFNGVLNGGILKNIVLDGNHRLTFAELNHAATIGVKYITEEQLHRCIVHGGGKG